MKLESVALVHVSYEPRQGNRIKVGRLARLKGAILFEYDESFVAGGLEISPFHLRLQRGLIEGRLDRLDGLPGVFDDSLPDGWGRLLLDRRARQLGIRAAALSPLDRLSVVGATGMGALVYEPEATIDAPRIVKLAALAEEAKAVQLNADAKELEALLALGGSPKGARPKLLVQIDANGKLHAGAHAIAKNAAAWLVKFPAREDDPASGALEHAYALMARAAGIHVPVTQLLGRTKSNRGYFAIERFDRVGARRVHVHTLGGMLQVPVGYPALDYLDLLKVTRELTRNEASVAEAFRRACFNVLAINRDDHPRNFAFLMDENGKWAPSPAYDLTFAPLREHTMLVSGVGKPRRADLVRLAEQGEVKRALRIIADVDAAVRAVLDFAKEAGVPLRLAKEVHAAVLEQLR